MEMHEGKWFMAFLLAAGLTACDADRPGANDANEAEDVAENQAEEAQEAFSRTAKSRIDAMQEQADQFESRVGEAPENMREELQAQIDDWQRRADDVENRIDDFDAQTPQQWSEFETRMNSELDELDRTLNELSQRVGNPPAR